MLKTITIHIDFKPQEIIVGSARKVDGIRRLELMVKAAAKEEASLTDRVALFLYPTCICSVREPEDFRDLSLEDFLKVDEADIDTWMATAYEVNPQWRSAYEASAVIGEGKKTIEIGTPSTGSSQPTEVEPTTN
jgi:hypothetical protein